jgi:hypothetical protein
MARSSHQGCVCITPKHLEGLGANSEVDYPDNGDGALATNRTLIIPIWFKIFQPDRLFIRLWAQALEVNVTESFPTQTVCFYRYLSS